MTTSSIQVTRTIGRPSDTSSSILWRDMWPFSITDMEVDYSHDPPHLWPLNSACRTKMATSSIQMANHKIISRRSDTSILRRDMWLSFIIDVAVEYSHDHPHLWPLNILVTLTIGRSLDTTSLILRRDMWLLFITDLEVEYIVTWPSLKWFIVYSNASCNEEHFEECSLHLRETLHGRLGPHFIPKLQW